MDAPPRCGGAWAARLMLPPPAAGARFHTSTGTDVESGGLAGRGGDATIRAVTPASPDCNAGWRSQMKADALFKWLMPREDRFHDLFGRDTANLLRAARSFSEIVYCANLAERRVKSVALRSFEHDGDAITRQIFEALNSTFITPLDREDIRSIATHLDDIMDFLEGVARQLVLFDLAESPEALRQFADILVHMIEEIERLTPMIWDTSNEAAIRDAIVRLSDFENRADTLYDTVIADLFRAPHRDPIEIMKWKEIYEGLEDACDSCKHYSVVLGNVVIKNA
jgi:predicted phosphate transport protein (TIGR00153 family)